MSSQGSTWPHTQYKIAPITGRVLVRGPKTPSRDRIHSFLCSAFKLTDSTRARRTCQPRQATLCNQVAGPSRKQCSTWLPHNIRRLRCIIWHVMSPGPKSIFGPSQTKHCVASSPLIVLRSHFFEIFETLQVNIFVCTLFPCHLDIQ